MLKRYSYMIVIGSLLLVQGCGVLIFNEAKMARKKHRIHEEQYQPYKLQNTIEGYKEFIVKYPKNIYVNEAKLRIENLEFAPYEQADTIEGYMEFKMRYPHNRHVFKANVKIEQVEVKRYEKMDTIEGYKEFLLKYPESTFAVLAKESLQELEFREFDSTLRKKYGFDLLLYRLKLKRLKKKLGTVGGVNLGDFTCFASMVNHEGKRYFHTHLIYPTNLSHLDYSSREVLERFFDPIVSKALVYLNSHFMTKGEIDGFSFDVSSSAHFFYGDRKVFLEYYFLLNQVRLFAQHKLGDKEILANSMMVSPQKLVSEAKQEITKKVSKARKELAKKERTGTERLGKLEEKAHLKKITIPPVMMDGFRIMTMVSERDRGKDFIISSSWEKGRHAMQTIEKRKNLGGKDGFRDKAVIKYLYPPGHYGTSFLIWNYKHREKALWYRSLHGAATRIISTERYRPPAESDFCLTDYLEIKVKEEKHELLRSEDYKGKTCYIVESIPIKKDIRYGKRISWIDRQYFIPLKIEYFDNRGMLWKVLTVEWQNKFGFWFWKKAVVENAQKGSQTIITIDDVRVNIGLHNRDFTTYGLEQRKHGF